MSTVNNSDIKQKKNQAVPLYSEVRYKTFGAKGKKEATRSYTEIITCDQDEAYLGLP